MVTRRPDPMADLAGALTAIEAERAATTKPVLLTDALMILAEAQIPAHLVPRGRAGA